MVTEKRYVCEGCDGAGTRRVAVDGDLGKNCLRCGGRGFVTEREMIELASQAKIPALFDWRIFAREYKN